MLESKCEKQQTFIRSVECNDHMGLKEDELGNALIPEHLPSAAAKKSTKLCKPDQMETAFLMLYH